MSGEKRVVFEYQSQDTDTFGANMIRVYSDGSSHCTWHTGGPLEIRNDPVAMELARMKMKYEPPDSKAEVVDEWELYSDVKYRIVLTGDVLRRYFFQKRHPSGQWISIPPNKELYKRIHTLKTSKSTNPGFVGP